MNTGLLERQITEALHSEADAVEVEVDLDLFAAKLDGAPIIPIETGHHRRRVAAVILGSAACAAAVAGGAMTIAKPDSADVTTVGNNEGPAETVPSTVPKSTSTVPSAPVAPSLSITSPESGASYPVGTQVTVTGNATPGAHLYVGTAAIEVHADGTWATQLYVSKAGKNWFTFSITNVDAMGALDTSTRGELGFALYGIAEKTETTAPAPVKTEPIEKTPTEQTPSAELVANQMYGTCNLTPPYDKFYGTGTPGRTVTISSAYGSGSISIDSSGYWQKKVHFDTAPAYTPFNVSVSDGYTTATFSFTYTP